MTEKEARERYKGNGQFIEWLLNRLGNGPLRHETPDRVDLLRDAFESGVAVERQAWEADR
jgi:hypothetical protein